MSASCCDHAVDPHRGNQSYRRVLWAVLAINGAMFAVEVAAGLAAGSAALAARPAATSTANIAPLMASTAHRTRR